MEDSPLSITANIAGILTLAAAIIASVYVRYTILRRGYDEIETTVDSTRAGFWETKAIMESQCPEDTRPEAARLQRLTSKMLEIDKVVTEKYKGVFAVDPPGRPSLRKTHLRDAWLLTVFGFIVTLGRTPMLFYWYSIREEVLEKVRQQDILRSQIRHQQIILLHADIREVKSALSGWEADAESREVRLEDAEVVGVGEGGENEQDRARD